MLVIGYRRLLARLRVQATPAPAPVTRDAGLSDAELDRYARHLVLHQIGGAGQMRLKGARVLVVGAGGLGSPVCLYLAAAGVGRITLADDDTVSLSNLQRQVIFRDDLRGEPKAYAAAEAMLRLNPHLDVTPLIRRITEGDSDLIAGHDLVIDGTDSFAGRAAINRACVAAGVPLLSGAIGQWEGQVTLFDPARGGPCMACLFPMAPERDAPAPRRGWSARCRRDRQPDGAGGDQAPDRRGTGPARQDDAVRRALWRNPDDRLRAGPGLSGLRGAIGAGTWRGATLGCLSTTGGLDEPAN